MKVIGTIVITDPCYLEAPPLNQRNTIYGDWSCMVYLGDLESNTLCDEWNQYYFKFFRNYNDEGIYKTEENRKKMHEDFKAYKKKWLENYCLGEFCADAGEVGIFKYDDLTDKDKEFCKTHPWCACIIEDFDGDVDFLERDRVVYVVGKGNKNFFSVQSGL